MRSICWTDHANVTKQQVLEDIDVKHLRWISEIIADGTVIKSLSGRSANLGDGPSRNPPDRDALMEQRTKDLAGVIGQARGFDLDEFLSDWERRDGKPIPWVIGDPVPVPARGPGDREAELPPALGAAKKPDQKLHQCALYGCPLPADPEVARFACSKEHQDEADRTTCDVWAVRAAAGWPEKVVTLYAPD
jgi:hypothetical protein